MDEKKYIKRLFDEMLSFSLKTKSAVVVEGPKWCGKSTTCKRQAKEVVDLMPVGTRSSIVAEARIAPHEFLTMRQYPLLIDEWQHIAFIWDQLKVEADESGAFGRFILTGSVTDRDYDDAYFKNEDKHTGNGRIVRRRMRTMTLFESGEGNGEG